MSRLIIWLVVLSLGLLFVPLYLISDSLRQENVRLQTEATLIQQTLAVSPQPNSTEAALTDTLMQIQAQKGALEAIQPTLIAEHIPWSEVMFMLGSYDPNQLSITALSQSGNQLAVQGQAADQSQVMAYVESLKKSDLFADVVVQSMISGATPQAGEVGDLIAFIILVEFA